MTLIIDVHAHVFNARDLPISGFLSGYLGVPRYLTRLLEKALQKLTERPSFAVGLSAEELHDDEVSALLRELLVENPDIEALAIEERGQGPQTLLGMGDIWATMRDYVRWAGLLTKTQMQITDRLVRTYPTVDLFTPLMMDMENWVGSRPDTAIHHQIEIMSDVTVVFGGRVHPFLAFDPERARRDIEAGRDPLAFLKTALTRGFLGVKIYPPMGYRPLGNVDKAADVPYGGDPRCAGWDEALHRLYLFCTEQDVPVTAHCSDGGAEADPRNDTGKEGHPRYWKTVLQAYPTLRVNLGHFGGVDDLIERGEQSWAWHIGQLMTSYPNVYADTGHHDLDNPVFRSAYKRTLRRLVEAHPRVAERLLFGTDWHMIVREPHPERFLDEYVDFYRDALGESGLASFLGGGALGFLGVREGKARARLSRFYHDNGLPPPSWFVEAEAPAPVDITHMPFLAQRAASNLFLKSAHPDLARRTAEPPRGRRLFDGTWDVAGTDAPVLARRDAPVGYADVRVGLQPFGALSIDAAAPPTKRYFVKSKPDAMMPMLMGIMPELKAVSDADTSVYVAEMEPQRAKQLEQLGSFEVYEDFRFDLFPDDGHGPWWLRAEGTRTDMPPGLTQDSVMAAIGAPAAWQRARGGGVTIAIVDTGVDGRMQEFAGRQSSFSYAKSPLFHGRPWEDGIGHGTMCAAVACGSRARGGRYDGVAPDAAVLAARTDLTSIDVYRVYEHLLRQYRAGSFPGGLVISNSFGHYLCNQPAFPDGHPYVDLVRACVAAGIVVVFAAGNNHAEGLCRFEPTADHPNTIWAVNSIDEVITVGTVDWDGTNQAPGEHANSSRGPGQWSTYSKPDVVAPTYGEVAWGNGYRQMAWWGTSGACPQVAGLAALLLERDPTLKPADIKALIKKTAKPLAGPTTCVGAGMIDCDAAVP